MGQRTLGHGDSWSALPCVQLLACKNLERAIEEISQSVLHVVHNEFALPLY